MPSPSRRTVLATGSALGGTLLTAGVPAQASAADHGSAPSAPQALSPSSDPWRTVLDDADLVWQRMPKTRYEGPYLGNGFLGSGPRTAPARWASRAPPTPRWSTAARRTPYSATAATRGTATTT